MKLSVLMAVYNGAQQIEASLLSLKAALPPDSELILINDGSTDDTAERIAGLEIPQLRVFHQENRGLTASLNRALQESSGEYIARLDCGDQCHPERLSLQLSFLDEHSQILLAGCRIRRLDKDKVVLGFSDVVREPKQIHKGLMRINLFQHSSIMLRREAMLAVGGYREFFRYAQDLDLYLRLAERGPLANLPQVLSDWVLDPSSISFRWRSSQNAYAELARQSARDRRAGRPDPVEDHTAKAPGHAPENPARAEGLYHLEVGRSCLMGGHVSRARQEFKLAGESGVSVAPSLILLSRLPRFLRDVLRKTRVSLLCR